MSDSNKKEIKEDLLGGINLGGNALLSILGRCLKEAEKALGSECLKEVEKTLGSENIKVKTKENPLRKDRGFGLSFVDSNIPEGIEVNDDTKVDDSFDVKNNEKAIFNAITDFILETAKNSTKSDRKPMTVHASPDRIKEILNSLEKLRKEDYDFEKSSFNARNLTPKNLEVLMGLYSIEEIASKYRVSVDEIKLLCKLWNINIDKKDVQIYTLDDLNLFNIVNGYLSIIESMGEENNIELIKHFIESFNYSLSLLKLNIDIEGRILLPIICKQFNPVGNMTLSVMLIGLKSSLPDVMKEIEKYGYFNYVDKLLN